MDEDEGAVADDTNLLIQPSGTGNVSVFTPKHYEREELVEHLRAGGLVVEGHTRNWAGPYEVVLAVTSLAVGGGGVGGLIVAWLQARPTYTMTVDLGDGRSITRSARNLPTPEELRQIDELFAANAAQPVEPAPGGAPGQHLPPNDPRVPGDNGGADTAG